MKIQRKSRGIAAGIGILALTVSIAQCQVTINQSGTSGTTYTGNDDGQGSSNLGREINYVTIANNSVDLFITVGLTPTANIQTDGKFNYIIGIATGSGGDTAASGNPYGDTISFSSASGGMNYFIGAYDAGSSPYTSFGFNDSVWNGTSWTQIENVASGEPEFTQSGASNPDGFTLTVPLSDFSLTAGESIDFDVDATGSSGANTAYDSLALPGIVQPNVPYWHNGTSESGSGTFTNGYVFTENTLDEYTVAPAPEPTALAFAGLGGLSLILFRRQGK